MCMYVCKRRIESTKFVVSLPSVPVTPSRVRLMAPPPLHCVFIPRSEVQGEKDNKRQQTPESKSPLAADPVFVACCVWERKKRFHQKAAGEGQTFIDDGKGGKYSIYYLYRYQFNRRYIYTRTTPFLAQRLVV